MKNIYRKEVEFTYLLTHLLGDKFNIFNKLYFFFLKRCYFNRIIWVMVKWRIFSFFIRGQKHWL